MENHLSSLEQGRAGNWTDVWAQHSKPYSISHTLINEELGTLGSGSQLVLGNLLGVKGKWGVDEPFAAVLAGEVTLCIRLHRTSWQLG